MQKKIKQYIFIGMLFITLVLFGVNYFLRPFEGYFVIEDNTVEQFERPNEEETKEPIVLTKVDILNKLSTEEKVAQMIAYPLLIDEDVEMNDIESIKDFFMSDDATVSATMEIENLRLDKLSPGFITIFGSKIASETAKQTISEVKNLYKDNILSPRFIVDHEGGTVQRLSGEGYTKLPSWREMCEMQDEEITGVLRESASELSNTGINIVLAPVLDVGNSSIFKDRICSNSYAVVANKSITYTSVFNSFDILPVIKHFPGIGNVNKDLHNNFDFVEVLANDVKLYKYVIENSAQVAVMVSHAGVTSQNSQLPCSLSKDCVGELETAYPYLMVFSDALEMKSASFNKDNINEPKDLVQVSKEAVLAGNEVLIYGQSVRSSDMKKIIFSLSREYEQNTEFKDLVDKAVSRIIDYKHMER